MRPTIELTSTTLRQSVSEGDTAWHAEHWGTNLCSVGIEVVSGGSDFTEAQIETLASLVAEIRSRCGIGAEDVIRHYDVTGKLCPAPYVDGGKWAALHARICGGNASGGDSYSGGSSVEGDTADLARRVINGEFGNGDARKAALGDRYSEVQAEVNRILSSGGEAGSGGSSQSVDIDDLARRVINGEFGNGDDRRNALGGNYDAVQARVNEMLGCGSSSGDSGGGVDIESLAWAVINGDYGNGEERRQRLGANYDAVQARVNEILS